MINRRILANLVLFFALSAGLVIYGFLTLFGNPWAHPTTISTELPEAGGIRKGFSASHDGVVVGTVSKVALSDDGVRISVELDPGTSLPSNVQARVIRASAVGEQRLDFVTAPGTIGQTAPDLADGAEVPPADDPTPPAVDEVLATVTGFVSALPTEDLNTVLHESAVALSGRGDDLRSMTSSLTTISNDVIENEASLRRLLEVAPPVLDEFSTMSPEIHDALDNTAALTDYLADVAPRLNDLAADGAAAATTIDGVVVQHRDILTCLTSRVASVSEGLQGQALADLDRGLETNQWFFGLIDKVAVRGAAASGPYGPATPDQLWLRTTLQIPPQTPAASAYRPPRAPLVGATAGPCEATTWQPDAAVAPASPGGPTEQAQPQGVELRERSNAGVAAPDEAQAPSGPLDGTGQASRHWTLNRWIVPISLIGIGLVVLWSAHGSSLRRFWRTHVRRSSNA